MPSNSIEDYARALSAAGHERWSVKTAADSDAQALVGQVPTSTDIATLCQLDVPNPAPTGPRSDGTEKTIFTIVGKLVGYRLESDGDYHLVIGDQNGNTMIAEIPNPADAAGSYFLDQITATRQAFDAHFQLPEPTTAARPEDAQNVKAASLFALPLITSADEQVTITGIGFFDFIHGQTGVAPNGIELHPVVNIVFAG
jgi:hypothetical protein